MLEVEGDPDMRALAGSDRKKKKRGRGRCWAGSSARWATRCEDGPREGVGLRAGKRNIKGRKKMGRALAYQAGRKRGGEMGLGLPTVGLRGLRWAAQGFGPSWATG
jgi:hypothetical protein